MATIPRHGASISGSHASQRQLGESPQVEDERPLVERTGLLSGEGADAEGAWLVRRPETGCRVGDDRQRRGHAQAVADVEEARPSRLLVGREERLDEGTLGDLHDGGRSVGIGKTEQLVEERLALRVTLVRFAFAP